MLSGFMTVLPTVLIALVLAGIVAAIIAGIVRDRKRGRHICGGNCGQCPMGGSCHRQS